MLVSLLVVLVACEAVWPTPREWSASGGASRLVNGSMPALTLEGCEESCDLLVAAYARLSARWLPDGTPVHARPRGAVAAESAATRERGIGRRSEAREGSGPSWYEDDASVASLEGHVLRRVVASVANSGASDDESYELAPGWRTGASLSLHLFES